MFVSGRVSNWSDVKPETWSVEIRAAYAYLLGIYLGDGTVTRHGKSFGLHVYLDSGHPGIVEECANAIDLMLPGHTGRYRRPETNCLRLSSYNQAWTTLFPQHGPGKKHERKIELAGWQQEIVDVFPEQFLRGLIHSDGSRCRNTFTVHLKSGPKEYTYPRYFFTNYSEDIRRIFTDTCDQIGVRWTLSNWRNISISHRDSVAFLDTFIGPKF